MLQIGLEYGYSMMNKMIAEDYTGSQSCPCDNEEGCNKCVEELGSEYYHWLGDGTKPDFEERLPFEAEGD